MANVNFYFGLGVTVTPVPYSLCGVANPMLFVHSDSDEGKTLKALLAKKSAANHVCYIIGFRGVDVVDARKLVMEVSDEGNIIIGVGLHRGIKRESTPEIWTHNDAFGINVASKVQFYGYETADILGTELHNVMNRNSESAKKLESMLISLTNPDGVCHEQPGNKICYAISLGEMTDSHKLVVKVWDGRISIGVGLRHLGM